MVGPEAIYLRRTSEYSELSHMGYFNIGNEQSQYSDYITVRCGFTANLILGFFVFEKNNPQGS